MPTLTRPRPLHGRPARLTTLAVVATIGLASQARLAPAQPTGQDPAAVATPVAEPVFLVSPTTPARSDADFALSAGRGVFRPPLEWSTWLGLGYGTHGHLALGLDLSLPISAGGNLRLGGWGEARALDDDRWYGGAELLYTAAPSRMTLAFYQGSAAVGARAGRSRDRYAAALTYGYLAPWWLEGECRVRFFGIRTGVCEARRERVRHGRYVIGVRGVVHVTRAIDDADDWTLAIGLEVEPLGLLRAALAIESWY